LREKEQHAQACRAEKALLLLKQITGQIQHKPICENNIHWPSSPVSCDAKECIFPDSTVPKKYDEEDIGYNII